MKKRLLITSIVMMLVIAVALSTATYAWFTSSTEVSASSVTLTAQTNSAAALGIGWTGGTAGTSITTTKSGTVDPLCPAELNNGTTTSSVTFKTAKVKTVNNTLTFQAPTVGSATVFESDDQTPVQTFYISNLSGTNKISQITLTASIAASGTDGSGLIRIAVFKKTSPSNNYVLVGVLASEASVNTVVGTPAENKNSTPVLRTAVDSDNPMYYVTTPVTSLALGGLAANASHELKVLIWMDGQALDDSKQGVGATVGLTFNAGTSGPDVTPANDANGN